VEYLCIAKGTEDFVVIEWFLEPPVESKAYSYRPTGRKIEV